MRKKKKKKIYHPWWLCSMSTGSAGAMFPRIPLLGVSKPHSASRDICWRSGKWRWCGGPLSLKTAAGHSLLIHWLLLVEGEGPQQALSSASSPGSPPPASLSPGPGAQCAVSCQKLFLQIRSPVSLRLRPWDSNVAPSGSLAVLLCSSLVGEPR